MRAREEDGCAQATLDLRAVVETCIVPYDHMLRIRIAVRNLIEKNRDQIKIDRRHIAKLAAAFDHVQCPVDVSPLVFLLRRFHNPMPPQTPASALNAMQTVPGFILNPNANPLAALNPEALQLVVKVLFEGFSLFGILLHMCGTR